MTNTKYHSEKDNMRRINMHGDNFFLSQRAWKSNIGIFFLNSLNCKFRLLLSPYLLSNFHLCRVRNHFPGFSSGTENLFCRNPWDNDFSEIELSSIFKKVFILKPGLRSQAGQDSEDSVVVYHSRMVLCC